MSHVTLDEVRDTKEVKYRARLMDCKRELSIFDFTAGFSQLFVFMLLLVALGWDYEEFWEHYNQNRQTQFNGCFFSSFHLFR